MTMHPFLLSLLLFPMVLALATPSPGAADPSVFEVMGLRAGMTVDQVKQVVEQQELGPPKLVRAPSFEQEIALARKEHVAANEYKGVQTLRSGDGEKRVQVFFVATPKGPVSTKITVEVFGGTSVEEFSETLVSRYGPPERKSDREWIWGDTGMFYARTNPYFEFQPKPASATAPKPVARLILADPALQRHSREVIAREARKGS